MVIAVKGLGSKVQFSNDEWTNLPQALDMGPLGGHLGYLLRRLQIQVFHDFIRTMAPFKLRPGQYSILVLIAANAGPSQAQIGRTLKIERARIARMLKELERRGWVRRLPVSYDKRAHALFLTGKGQKVLDHVLVLGQKHEARMSRLLGAQRRRDLLSQLRPLVDAVRPVAGHQ